MVFVTENAPYGQAGSDLYSACLEKMFSMAKSQSQSFRAAPWKHHEMFNLGPDAERFIERMLVMAGHEA